VTGEDGRNKVKRGNLREESGEVQGSGVAGQGS